MEAKTETKKMETIVKEGKVSYPEALALRKDLQGHITSEAAELILSKFLRLGWLKETSVCLSLSPPSSDLPLHHHII